jgi:hypothetical protein
VLLDFGVGDLDDGLADEIAGHGEAELQRGGGTDWPLWIARAEGHAVRHFFGAWSALKRISRIEDRAFVRAV